MKSTRWINLVTSALLIVALAGIPGSASARQQDTPLLMEITASGQACSEGICFTIQFTFGRTAAVSEPLWNFAARDL